MTVRWRLGMLAISLGSACVGGEGDVETGQVTESLTAVTWTDTVGVTADGNDLTKTSSEVGWNAGAASVESLNGDGYVEFTTLENNKSKMAGLSWGNGGTGNADIDFAILLQANGTVSLREGAASLGDFGSYVRGDVFRVQVVGGVVSYWRNGAILRYSTATPTFPLLVDTSLSTPGATIADAVLETEPFWSAVVGAAADGNDLTKTSSQVGWNAGAESVETLSGDGYVEFTTLENTTAKVAGLSWAWHSSNTGNANIDFAIDLRADGTVGVLEGGASRGSFGPYAPGDVFRVQVADAACGGVVTYWRNGILLYTSTARTDFFPLLVDTSLYTPGATIVDAVLETKPFWTGVVGAAADGNDLTRASGRGWTAGATSIATLPGDGYAEFTALESTTAKMAGLSNGNSGTGYDDIDFAIFLKADGAIGIREGGVTRGRFGTYAAGDVFRVQVVGGVVTYWQNGALLWTSSATPTFPLLLDTSLAAPGATIADAVLESEPFWTAVVGADDDGDDLTRKSTATGWTAGAASIATLSGDGFAVFTTGENTTAKMAGLSSGDGGTGYDDIDFAIFLKADGTFAVREGGVSRGAFGAYAAGDVFRVATTGGVVTYARNGVVFYTSAQAPRFPLLFDTSLRTPAATILGARLVSIGEVPVFDNADQTFVWRPTLAEDGGILQRGAFLDLTRPAAEQSCTGTLAGVEFFRVRSDLLTTSGEVLFRSWRNPDLPPRGARLAAAEDVLVEWDGLTYRYTPPLAKAPGDVVGPDDRWVFGDPTYPTSWVGVQTEHFQDPCGCESPPDQRWFESGIVGVQFDAADGIHYGFVEVEWIPSPFPNNPERDNYIAIRWGYNPVAGEPLVIPP